MRLIDRDFRERVRAVQSVDRMVASLRATLARAGVAERTAIVFSSDNGLHMGEHGLGPGKQTPFDTDVNVPLIVAGPGIAPGTTVTLPAENIDLRPTFAEWAGLRPPPGVDGSSLVPLLRGERPVGWREVALIEHHPAAADGPGTVGVPRGPGLPGGGSVAGPRPVAGTRCGPVVAPPARGRQRLVVTIRPSGLPTSDSRRTASRSATASSATAAGAAGSARTMGVPASPASRTRVSSGI